VVISSEHARGRAPSNSPRGLLCRNLRAERPAQAGQDGERPPRGQRATEDAPRFGEKPMRSPAAPVRAAPPGPAIQVFLPGWKLAPGPGESRQSAGVSVNRHQGGGQRNRGTDRPGPIGRRAKIRPFHPPDRLKIGREDHHDDHGGENHRGAGPALATATCQPHPTCQGMGLAADPSRALVGGAKPAVCPVPQVGQMRPVGDPNRGPIRPPTHRGFHGFEFFPPRHASASKPINKTQGMALEGDEPGGTPVPSENTKNTTERIQYAFDQREPLDRYEIAYQ